MNRESEKWIERRLVTEMIRIGAICLKFTPSTQTGYPDRIILINGHAIFVELKSTEKKPRELQKIRFEQMEHEGFRVHVIENEEQLKELIYEIQSL